MAEAGESMGRFGAAMGAGAAKLGKKAAQSEAGRSAGRAAISGATEGVKDDLTNRYLGGTPPPLSPSTPDPAPSSSSVDSKPNPPPSIATSHKTSTPPPSSSSSSSSSFSHSPRPPKPSMLSRFKPHIGKSSSKTVASRPVRQTSRKDRVYKYNLAREADWDNKLRVQTQYNFKSDQRNELEFRKGQIIEVLTRTDTPFDWWEGKLENRVGIFPANYVKIIRD